MNFNETNEFTKNFKRLSKKYKSLPDDLLEFKKVVSESPLGNKKHFVILHNQEKQEKLKIVKARFFCKYLRGASLRIVYAYRQNEEIIDFIEVYFKGERVSENKALINEYLRQLNKKYNHG